MSSAEELMEDCSVFTDYAVVVENLSFRYNKSQLILNNFCMKVKRGEIYALLGSNGSGKTTLLKLILGRGRPEKGKISVLGQRPGAKNSLIPGPSVGYMPQEIGLMTNLTVEENLRFFSKLFHINCYQFEERFGVLTQLFNLCENNRRIDQLSAGQQRLVSMAVAIIHRPQLIILDEPTVGVDPIIRNRIWAYLEALCQIKGNTVIITTHYIEEAKRASTVGFMKSGSILRQSNPQNLMNEYQCSTLEGVYLNLWEQKDQELNTKISQKDNIEPNFVNSKETDKSSSKQILDFYRVMALIWKFNLRFKKDPLNFVLFMILPFISIFSLYLAVGHTPHDIPVAIFAEEPETHLHDLFIESIDKNILNIIEYETKDLAIDSIVEGKNTFAIFFEKNFTERLEERILNPFYTDVLFEGGEDGSFIKLYTDNTRPLVLLNGLQYFAEVIQRLVSKVSLSMGIKSDDFTLPVSIEQPIYGFHPISGHHSEKFKANYHCLVPGFLIVIFHLTSVVSSCFIVVNNKRDSHMSRFLFSGGQPIELIVAHYLSVMAYLLIQVLVLLMLGSYVLDFRQKGSYFEVYLFCVLQSLQGLSIGLMIALPIKDELTIMTIVALLVGPLYYISGLFWPIEGIPSYFRVFSDWTPISKPIESLRSVMLRGWDYRHPNVLTGYIVSISYTLVISIFNLVYFHIQQDPFI